MHAVIAAIETESALPTRNETTTLVAILLSNYPHARGQLPQADWVQYVLRLQEAFAAYPAIVGFQAISTAKGLPKHHKFVPNPHEIAEFCDGIKIKLGVSKAMAQRHIDESKRRAAERQWVPPTPEQKARVQAMVDGIHRGLKSTELANGL